MVDDCRSDGILMLLVDQGTLRLGKTSGKGLVPGKSETQKEIAESNKGLRKSEALFNLNPIINN